MKKKMKLEVVKVKKETEIWNNLFRFDRYRTDFCSRLEGLFYGYTLSLEKALKGSGVETLFEADLDQIGDADMLTQLTYDIAAEISTEFNGTEIVNRKMIELGKLRDQAKGKNAEMFQALNEQVWLLNDEFQMRQRWLKDLIVLKKLVEGCIYQSKRKKKAA